MLEISDAAFEKMIGEAMDAIPEQYARNMNNVAVTWDHEPTQHQREKMKLRGDQQLFGLYEGIPLTQRNGGYNLVLPDKITIFMHPMVDIMPDIPALERQVRKTLWHEVAHHFGLNHEQIEKLERS